MNSRSAIPVALFGIGLVSISTQIYLLREFMSVFQGNELIFGIVLANWMLLTGIGAFLGKFFKRVHDKEVFILFLLLLLSLLPILTLLKLNYWKMLVFPVGTMIGLEGITYSSLLIQLPFCLINGFLFTALANQWSQQKQANWLGTAYSIESAGSMAGGILVNLIFLWIFPTYLSMKLIAVLCLLLVVWYSFGMSGVLPKILVVLTAGILIVGLFLIPFQKIVMGIQFPEEEVIYNQDTPYGRVVVTESSGQKNVYENGLLLFSSGNVIQDEESVHYAMVQHPSPEYVLLISGGSSGALDEIRKYRPVAVDYMEINPALIEIRKLWDNDSVLPGVTCKQGDARRLIQRDTLRYDVILLCMPEPSTIQINRYYTDEFFSLLKNHLRKGGIVSMSLPTSSDYVSETAGRLNSSLFVTLKKHFREVFIIPSNKNHFLGSDSTLSLDIPELIHKRGIQTAYVNQYYLNYSEIQTRSDLIQQHISMHEKPNRDYQPVTYLRQLSFWLSYERKNGLFIGLLLLILILLIFFSVNQINAGLLAGGFTASSIEIILLLAFQVVFGYVYQILGIIIMIFMLGLAMGAASLKRMIQKTSRKHYIMIQIVMAIISLTTLLLIFGTSFMCLSNWIVMTLLGVVTWIVSFAVGLEFAIAAELSEGTNELITARNYSVDLYGSALGAFLTVFALLPVLGTLWTLVFLAGLNMLTAGLFFLRKKN